MLLPKLKNGFVIIVSTQFCNVPNEVISNINLIASATNIAPPNGIIDKNGFATFSGTESGIFIVKSLLCKYAKTLIDIKVINNAGNTPDAPNTLVGISPFTIAPLIVSPFTTTSETAVNGVTNKNEAKAITAPTIPFSPSFFV